MGAATLSGCQEENPNPNNGNSEGNYIPFAVSETKTRTVYDETDQLQLNWVTGDKVRIFCDQAADKTTAEYGITDISKNNCNLAANSDGLKWGGYDNEHTFYAVYPSDETKVSVTDGIAELKINRKQEVTLGSLNGTVYSTTPDMSNAYMVACTTAVASETTSDKPVELKFSPIMTTLKIVVSGKADNSTSVQLTGVSLIMSVPADVAKSGNFKYDIRNGEIVQSDNTDKTTFSSETIFINIKTADGTDAVTLEGGQSIELLAFLPPVPINNSNQVTVKVHTTGEGVKSLTLGKFKKDSDGNETDEANFDIAASSKATVSLPKIPTDQQGNNWITPLDDDIYVQQLSIPGTHDAASYTTSLLNAGKTQTKDIGEQLNMGIRAFDMRPAYRTMESKMWLWHGTTSCDISLNEALTTMSTYLENNPGEFIILQFRHETEWSLFKDTDKWDTIYDELKNLNIVSWRPDLTIGECRGKFILITRTDFTNRENLGIALANNYANNDYAVGTLTNGSYSTNYHVQDYYQTADDNGATKIQKVKDLYAITKTFKLATNNFPWALNHTSGYVGTGGTTLLYIQNASYVNKPVYEALQAETELGPVGIVFMDYVGARTVTRLGTTYTVYGDLLPQAIIDNNYKYRMLRKGE